MPTAYKVLAQASPAASTNVDILTVAAGRQLVISTIAVCNTGSTDITYRIAIRPDGAALSTQHYIAFDAPLSGNSTDTITVGLTVDQSDVITVRSSAATTAFGVFGGEIT